MKRELGGLDDTEGAIFLGLKKPIIKNHGNSGARGMCNTILHAARVGNMDLGDKIADMLEGAGAPSD
jgi:fatty acid/phospholipid biosynthesis enzyme